MSEISSTMKSTAMEYWKHLNDWAQNPPTTSEDWQYAKMALQVIKTFVAQEAVENNRDAIRLSTAQYLGSNSTEELKQVLNGQVG